MKKFNFGRVKPSFLTIGAQKSGTTSLHNYLIQHPELIASKVKEIHFFDTNQSTEIRDYIKYFPKQYFTSTISFESTPRYMYYPEVAKKIVDFNPNMKFIILLRDPVKRAFSAWNMYKQMIDVPRLQKYFKELELKNPNERFYSCFYKNDFPSFIEWVEYELSSDFNKEFIEPSIIRRGYYKEQIEQYFRYFPKEQFFFIDSETLKNETLTILNLISEFLEINSFNKLKLDLNQKHVRTYNDRISDKTNELLLNHFKIRNKGLEKLVNLKLSWM